MSDCRRSRRKTRRKSISAAALVGVSIASLHPLALRAQESLSQESLQVDVSGDVAVPSAASNTATRELLGRLLNKPRDYDAAFTYATASIAGKDYEAAIVALERLLYFNPNFGRVKYELGILYFRLGSYAMAARYFEDALNTPGLEEAIRRRAQVMLPTAKKETSPSRFYGSVTFGLGYNSNLTQSRGFAPIQAYGAWTLNPNYVPKVAGANVTVMGDVLHVYDWQNGRGDVWETRLAGIGALQPSYSGYTAGYTEISTGPRIMIAPKEYPGASIKPYVVGDYSTIAGGGFGQTAGAGLTARLPVASTFRVEPRVEWRKINVSNPNMPYGSQYVFNSGSLLTGALSATWNVFDGVTLNGAVIGRRNTGYSAATSSRETAVQAGAKIDFDPPLETIGWRWSVSPFVRFAAFNFDAADPSINPLVARRDRQWRAGAVLDMPVTPDWGLTANIQYTRNNSNIVNYNMSSWSVLVGPTYRFTSVFDRRTLKDQASPVSTADWTGLHAGLNAGVRFGGNNAAASRTVPVFAQSAWEPDLFGSALAAFGQAKAGQAGAAVGAQAGWSWLIGGAALAGVEADFDIFSSGRRSASRIMNADASGPGFVDTVWSVAGYARRLDWLTTLRGRLGYLVTPELQLFGTAGPALGGYQAATGIWQADDLGFGGGPSYNSTARRTGVRVGYAAGGGAQWMFKPGWSLRLEYLYYDLGRVDYALQPLGASACGGPCFVSGVNASTKFNGNIVRAGLDYHFKLDDAPVVTRAVTK